MGTMSRNRARERQFVRAVARGMKPWAAARLASYAPQNSHRLARRLAQEIAAEVRKLAGIHGHIPAQHSKRDAPRVLKAELERIADYIGPRAKTVEGQSLRALAAQVKLADAVDHVVRVDRQVHREAQHGGPTPRTLKVRELARQLVEEIRKIESIPTYPDPHTLPRGRGSAEAPTPSNGQVGAPAQEPARCPTHPSQPANGCKLCPINDARRARDSDLFVEPELPAWVPRDRRY